MTTAGEALDALIATHEAAWRGLKPWDAEPHPPVLAAAAELLGVDPDALSDRVEGDRGCEPHDNFYADVVLAEALRMSARPASNSNSQPR
jgi:hypothetical protein